MYSSQGKGIKEKDMIPKKSQFYVEFLGWMECRGLRGRRYTEPVVRELRRRQKKMGTPPKLTIQVSRKELKISQEVDDKKKRCIKKIKFPSIPARDVTFVQQATRPGDGRLDDIVACIYLGYMPRTGRYVHVHVYRFDEASTATAFAAQMGAIAGSNMEHVMDVEQHLAAKGEIDDPNPNSDGISEPQTADSAVGSASSGYSDDDDSPSFTPKEIDPDLQSLRDVQPFDNVAEELRFRMKLQETPLLLPPKDYDTISRAQGNLMQVNERRCLNQNIVGDLAGTIEGNGSSESGVDLEGTPIASTAANTGGGHDKTASNNNSPATSPTTTKVQDLAQKLFIPLREKDASSQDDTNSQTSHGSHHRQGSNGSARLSQLTGNSSPSTPPVGHCDFVYPPKMSTPPVSPMLYKHALSNARLHRQDSTHSDGSSRLSQHSDLDRSRDEGNIMYYKGPNSDDIYAMPLKGSRERLVQQFPSPEGFPPADYYGDQGEPVQLRHAGAPRYRQPILTRSMPAELIRSEMVMSQVSGMRPVSGDMRALSGDMRPLSGDMRPLSGDMRHIRRTNSSNFAAVGRTESPVPHSPRVDSPSAMRAHVYGMGDARSSPRMVRVNSAKK